MADEKRHGGTPGVGPRSVTADELAADEQAIVAFFHFDAARCSAALGERAEAVGRIVESFGHVDPRVVAIRRELQRFTKLTTRLLDFQFTDLEP